MEPGHSPPHLSTASLVCVCVCVCVCWEILQRQALLSEDCEWHMIGEPGVEVAERQESHVFPHFQNRQALQVCLCWSSPLSRCQ